MPIGTSLGAYFNSEMEMYTKKYTPDGNGTDNNVVTPDELEGNDIMHKFEESAMGGIEVSQKNQMPFPDNSNPDSNFVNRFGNLPPSGILNDLKKPQDKPLIRKIAAVGNLGNSPDEIMSGLEGARQYPSGFSQPERVGRAALKNRDNGEVFEGQNHGEAFGKFIDKYPSESNFGKIDQGFTTTHGRFLSREEAFDMAKDQKQFIDKGIAPTKAFGLLSEDIN